MVLPCKECCSLEVARRLCAGTLHYGAALIAQEPGAAVNATSVSLPACTAANLHTEMWTLLKAYKRYSHTWWGAKLQSQEHVRWRCSDVHFFCAEGRRSGHF